jgi:hypothetical protein
MLDIRNYFARCYQSLSIPARNYKVYDLGTYKACTRGTVFRWKGSQEKFLGMAIVALPALVLLQPYETLESLFPNSTTGALASSRRP